MHAHTHTRTHTHTHTDMYTQTHTDMYAHTHTHVFTQKHTHTHTLLPITRGVSVMECARPSARGCLDSIHSVYLVIQTHSIVGLTNPCWGDQQIQV